MLEALEKQQSAEAVACDHSLMRVNTMAEQSQIREDNGFLLGDYTQLLINS